jgi:uncharacterized membrane protein
MRSALWFRPASLCIGVVLLAVLVALLEERLPNALFSVLPVVELPTVLTLLQVLAGSMLTVTTVTLSVLMLALSLAVAHASPRTVPELMADSVTQNALGTFLAAFVFSLTGLFLLGVDAVGQRAATLLYLLALVLAAAAVLYLVQWMHHVAGVIRINKVVDRIHGQSRRVLHAYFQAAGAAEAAAGDDGDSAPEEVFPLDTGYVQLIDVRTLDRQASEHELWLELLVREGAFVQTRLPVMRVRARGGAASPGAQGLAGCLVIGPERSPASDPLLGFELLAEIASRALSSGVNDPQTALLCIDHLCDLLSEAAAVAPQDYPQAWSPSGRVRLRRPDFCSMLERAYRPIMRDAAGMAEVMTALVQALVTIARVGQPAYAEALRAEVDRALSYALAHLHYEKDKQTLKRAAEGLQG